MPKNHRDRLKRQAAQIYMGLERVMEATIELKAEFDPYHPELSVALDAVLAGCLMNQEILTKFWTQAWGQEVIRWESWV